MDSQLLPVVDAFLQELITHPPAKIARRDYIIRALTLLGNPQNTVPAIHIAGTSGKGSTAYYITHLLISAGYSVGTLVSPHITSVTERSLINGAALLPDEYDEVFHDFCALYRKHGFHFSYFEFLTVFSFWLFRQKGVDYIVIETGIGGRLDATNVMTRPDTIRVITDIGLDHTELLGNTLAEIAAEKAGIIHPANVVVMNYQGKTITGVIATAAEANNARLIINEGMQHPVTDIQQRNWQLAQLAATQRLLLDEETVDFTRYTGPPADIVVPGRCEVHAIDDIPVIVDVAHNPQKLQGLITTLANQYPTKRPVFVIAFGQNKTATLQQSLAIINSVALSVIATNFSTVSDSHQSIPTARITASLSVPCTTEPSPTTALDIAIQQAKTLNSYVVVTGSFYLIGDIYDTVHSRAME